MPDLLYFSSSHKRLVTCWHVFISQSIIHVVLDRFKLLEIEVCPSDFECQNGDCVNSGGVNQCVCHDGYEGATCTGTMCSENTDIHIYTNTRKSSFKGRNDFVRRGFSVICP